MSITRRLNKSHMQVVQALCADPEHVLQEMQRVQAVEMVERMIYQLSDLNCILGEGADHFETIQALKAVANLRASV